MNKGSRGSKVQWFQGCYFYCYLLGEMPNANFLDVLDVARVEAYLGGTNKVLFEEVDMNDPPGQFGA